MPDRADAARSGGMCGNSHHTDWTCRPWTDRGASEWPECSVPDEVQDEEAS